MHDISLLLLFLPTSFFISITPGMCMTLAMTLGMSIGVRRTFYMMIGELLGVAIVAVAAVLGVATLMLSYPAIFTIFKWFGAAYLMFFGIQMWLNKGKLSVNSDLNSGQSTTNNGLIMQGFVTAVANPKGWAFMVSLLPPFINQDLALAPQLGALIAIILCMELLCMTLYASGGRVLQKGLSKSGNVTVINRISGSLMILVGVWLALG